MTTRPVKWGWVESDSWEYDFYAEVGQLISAYATAEAYANRYLRHLSGLSDKRARILFAGMRLPDIRERIRALARTVKNRAVLEEVNYLLDQLDKIRKVRDLLAHRVVTFPAGRAPALSNALVAKDIATISDHPVSADELRHMRLDCNATCWRFTFLHYRKPPAREELDRLFGAWLYKPPKQAPDNHRRRDRKPAPRRAPQRQPRPSRESQ